MAKLKLEELKIGEPEFDGNDEKVVIHVQGVCEKTSPFIFKGKLNNFGNENWDFIVDTAYYKTKRRVNVVQSLIDDIKEAIFRSEEFNTKESDILAYIEEKRKKQPLPEIEIVSQDLKEGYGMFTFTTKEIEEDINSREILYDPNHYDIYGYMPGAEGMMERGIVHFEFIDGEWRVEKDLHLYYKYSTYFGFKKDLAKELFETVKLSLLMHQG